MNIEPGETIGTFSAETIGPEHLRWLGERLGAIGLFKSLTAEHKESLLPSISLRRFPKGRRLIKEGDKEQALFVIYKGKVEVTKRRWLFFHRKVAELGEGDFFGEMALLTHSRRSASVATLEDSRIFVLHADDFKYLLEHDRALAEHVSEVAEKRRKELSS